MAKLLTGGRWHMQDLDNYNPEFLKQIIYDLHEKLKASKEGQFKRMTTLDEYTEHQETIGKLFICKSEEFGIALLLSIRANEKSWKARHKFVQLPHCGVLDWESVKNDKILQVWDNVSYMDSALKMLEKLKEG